MITRLGSTIGWIVEVNAAYILERDSNPTVMDATNRSIITRRVLRDSLLNLIPTHTRNADIVSVALSVPSLISPTLPVKKPIDNLKKAIIPSTAVVLIAALDGLNNLFLINSALFPSTDTIFDAINFPWSVSSYFPSVFLIKPFSVNSIR